MKYLLFVFNSSVQDLWRNKGRTFLTSLGILIGVLSVVLLTAFGLGLKRYIQNQFDSLGTNLVFVFPGQVLKNGSFSSSPGGLQVRFDERDLVRIKRIKGAEYVVPIYTKSGDIKSLGKTEFSTLFLTSAEFFPSRNFKAQYGKLFTDADDNKRAKIAVIGPKIAEKLFGSSANAIGKTVTTSNIRLKVVGVFESKGGGGFGGPDLDSYAIVPYKTGYIINTDKKFLQMQIKATNDKVLPQLKVDITNELLKRYHSDEFSLVEQTEIMNAITQIFGVLNIGLVAIAAISLVVGGIGIMNIMYVTVTERIKEIGIRRALGARKGDILWQFMIQAIILSLFGGLMGLGLAYGITFGIQRVFPAYIDTNSVALALGVSSLIGVVFGVFPAKKASDLSPIEAIRYE
ncbi:MAG: ABC transporter permease [Candidatus Roizmanbacteria bacterium]